MNRLFLINDDYYVLAFDYYDAIVKFKDYKKNYEEDIVEKIELITNDVIVSTEKIEKNYVEQEYDEE